MVSILKEENAVSVKFGGGLHTRASEEDINRREAHSGQNFDLDFQNQQLRNRAPFDLLGTVPNAAEIRGGATFLKSDGTVTMLVQAGGNVYQWGGTSFTLVGTCNSSAKLRGRLEAISTLDDLVLISDLNLSEPMATWDGTTFATMTHNLVGDFLAKYAWVENERAYYAHVISNGTTTAHMLVGSTVEDYTTLSTSNKPSSALAVTDPFYLLTPDLRPINGIVEAFGVIAISSRQGNLFKLTGTTAKDFALASLYPGSGASGDESVVYAGNDVLYGRQGRIESLVSTDKFGDVATDDLSAPIADQIEGYTDWLGAYNSRLNRTYFYSSGTQEFWVFHPEMISLGVSPWSRWNSQHAFAMTPTFMMNMLDPVDGLEYVYCGDSSGKFYRLEGTGSGDGGSANISTKFRSRLFIAPLDQAITGLQGFIKYRKGDAFTATIKVLWSGEAVYDETITLSASAVSRPLYGNSLYYSDGNYYSSSFGGRLVREPFGVAGKSNEFQVEIEVDGTANVEINEVLLRFEGAS